MMAFSLINLQKTLPGDHLCLQKIGDIWNVINIIITITIPLTVEQTVADVGGSHSNYILFVTHLIALDKD